MEDECYAVAEWVVLVPGDEVGVARRMDEAAYRSAVVFTDWIGMVMDGLGAA